MHRVIGKVAAAFGGQLQPFDPPLIHQSLFPRRSTFRDVLILLFLCYVAFWWNLGKLGLIDPDEPFYALTAREMVQSGDWATPQIFGAPQFEKPIFYYWTVAASYRLFGESEWSARFPDSVAATLLVFLTYAFARRVFNRRVGLIAGAFMTGGVELCLMGRLMLTDIPLTLFMTSALYAYWRALEEPERRARWVAAHFVCTGLAVLTKGPIGSLMPLFAIASFTFFGKRPWILRGPGAWIGMAAHAVIVVPWYSLMFSKYGWQFFDEFFYRDNWLRLIRAEHASNNHFWYYIVVLLVGSIPWLPAALMGLWRLVGKLKTSPGMFFCGCWFLPNLLFLTIAQSKLPSYAFCLFVPLAIAAGVALDGVLSRGFESVAERRVAIGAAILQALAGIVLSLMPLVRPLSPAIGALSVVLVVAVATLLMRRYRFWLVSTAFATVVFIFFALTVSFKPLDEMVSIRATAQKMKTEQLPGEPLLAGKFALRGVAFYTGENVAVLSGRKAPFWAAHPVEIVHRDDLDRLLQLHPSALCTMRHGDWTTFSKSDAFGCRDRGEWIGENLLIRAFRPAKAFHAVTIHPLGKKVPLGN